MAKERNFTDASRASYKINRSLGYNPPDLPGEEWRDIAGYEGIYVVSNLGRVKSLPRPMTDMRGVVYQLRSKLLLGGKNIQGYNYVSIGDANKNYKTRPVARLVALAFIPNPEGKREVNHKDGDKDNNRADNLEWVTPKENSLHCRRVLGKCIGELNSPAILKNDEVVELRKLFDGGMKVAEIAKICTKVKAHTIYHAVTRRTFKQVA